MFEKKKPDTYKKSICNGRIANHSDFSTDEQGRQLIKFTVAVNQKKEKPDYFDYIAYNAVARYVDRHIHNGMRVLVIGTDITGSYKDKNDTMHKTHKSECVDFIPLNATSENEMVAAVERFLKAIDVI